jgi:tRNA-Thr(GGU) m(6)t(6)A37 methyltransferase TsaA
MNEIVYKPIGVIYTPFKDRKDMPIQPIAAKGITGTVDIFGEYADGLKDLEGFSHIILLYHFHQSEGYSLEVKPFLDYNTRGIFATRAPRRPNNIGLSVVKLNRIENTTLYIENVDIMNGTPLLDIKPYVPVFDAAENSKIGWLSGSIHKLSTMKALDLIATSLNRHDDKPNQALADEIIRTNRTGWVKELVENLNNKDKNIQSDCLKVLYEIGERGAAMLIEPYCQEFGKLIAGKNNRLIWGAMIALDTVASVNPRKVYTFLSGIMEAIDKGSVITVDHGVSILAKLSTVPDLAGNTFPLLLEQLRKCPPKQLPQYAEKSEIAVGKNHREQFIGLLESRLKELDKDSQKKRIEKVIRKVDR